MKKVYKTTENKVKECIDKNRNNTNSISCNNCSVINISRNNNFVGLRSKWGNKQSTRSK